MPYFPTQAPPGMRDFDELRRWTEEEFRRVAGVQQELYEDPTIVRPEKFGAKSYHYGDATGAWIDSSDAFQEAVDYIADTALYGGVIQTSPGMYKTTKNIRVRNHGVRFRGPVQGFSGLVYNPSSAGTALTFRLSAPGAIYYCGIENFSITTQDTTTDKGALDIFDASSFRIDGLYISGYPVGAGLFTNGTDATGIRIGGRENIMIDNVTVAADYPMIYVPESAAGVVGMDSFSIGQNTLYTNTGTNPTVLILPGVPLANTVFRGPNNWIKANCKFRWNDPTAAFYSSDLTIANLKSEQATPAGDFTIDIDFAGAANSLQGFTLRDSMLGDGNGVRLRNVLHPELNNIDLRRPVTAGLTGLDWDAACLTMTLNRMHAHSSLSMSTGGMPLIRSDPWVSGGVIPFNAFYST